MTTITKANAYTTTDGETFGTFAAAKKNQDVIDRTARLLTTFGDTGLDMHEIASRAVEILAALTLPSGRAPRKPKPTDAAAAK